MINLHKENTCTGALGYACLINSRQRDIGKLVDKPAIVTIPPSYMCYTRFS